jgi:hypothetical protein
VVTPVYVSDIFFKTGKFFLEVALKMPPPMIPTAGTPPFFFDEPFLLFAMNIGGS